MKTLSTKLGFQLPHPDLLIEQLEGEDETSYISCERMASDSWEAGFCTDDLFYVAAQTYLERGVHNYYGYTYACSRHLRAVALALCVTLEERSLDRAYNEWTDKQHEKAQADLQEQQTTAAATEEGA
jgi:hypothetical protein